ncbi:Na+/H+ antiporter NhaA [Arcanobacterium bovis]|uniref:Na(+)/H(+) antiporter NhaA n=1 Tax=Arcanobacterium bovis TaxID=2529275 RepID=A0A4V6MYS6_9ACTO|nr:Na+/H+ antiporter NhaA [Arcanobacterium bovis]TBW20907.1 Na+/H+ antiporter NhaA [Arcanobacterium bovis]
MSQVAKRVRGVFSPGSYSEFQRIGEILRKETTGGIALIIASIIAIFWANSPYSDAYFSLRDAKLGFSTSWFHLDLSVGQWAADGLLAIFFFLVGLELKYELIAGDLRSFRKAVVPVVAAVGGVVVPAGVFWLVNRGNPITIAGWAIPTATDIAFAVAVLAIIGSHLPSPLRIFLLTLAVVDDLIAITIIAIFFTQSINFAALALFLVPVAAFAFAVQKFPQFFARHVWANWLILLPLAILAWVLLHESGIHATISGVVLGLAVPVRHRNSAGAPTTSTETESLSTTLEHRFRPLSSGFAVPIFAFFSAGVSFGGLSGLTQALTSPLTLGVIAGLCIGKPLGIVLSTYVVTKLTRASLDSEIRWIDLVGVGALAGIGFTVSLLVGELSFELGSSYNDAAKVGVLIASICAALIASIIVIPRNARYKKTSEGDTRDSDHDSIPDNFDKDPNDPTVC